MNADTTTEKTLLQSSLNFRNLGDMNISRLLGLEENCDELPVEIFVQKIKKIFDLQNVTYLCPSFPGRSLYDPYIVTTYSTEWSEHYKSNNYTAVDPVIINGCRSILPIDWMRLPKRSNPKVKKLFGEANEFGVGRQGLTVPVRGPLNGIWALLIVTSNANDHAWNFRHSELLLNIIHVAYYVHQRAYEIHVLGESIDLNTISRREREALSWCAEGKTVQDIGLLMSLSAETVKGYLDSARYRLRALSRTHAVVKAIRAGLIG